jgi:CRP/FNR family cyclic AMP-dependent transcriptional regulator
VTRAGGFVTARAHCAGVDGADRAAHVDALSRTSLLGRLDRAALDDLAERARVRSYQAGELLIEQGERGGSVLVLLAGAVTVYRRGPRGGRAALVHLRPPAALGEVTLLDAGPRSASVEAVEPTRALELDRADLLRALREHPGLLDGLLHALGGLVRRLSDRAADTFLLDLPGRVAKTLVVLAGSGRGPHVVRLSQSRLAELAGSSRQSLNETLSAFAERGLLHVEGRQVVIDDLDGLRRRAGVPPVAPGSRP